MANKVLADAIMAGLASALPTDNNADPLTGTIGRLFYATDENRWYQDDGTTWQQRKLALADLADVTYFGTIQPLDLLQWIGGIGAHWENTPRSAISVSDFANAAGDIDLNGHMLINLGVPTNPDDAATKDYVDTAVAGVGGGGASYQDGFQVFHYASQPTSGNDVAYDLDGSQPFGLIAYQEPPAANDEWKIPVCFAAGTYTITILYKKQGDAGITKFRFDAETEFATVDMYDPADQFNQKEIITGYVNAVAGPRWLYGLTDAQNGSSSDYRCTLTFIMATRTA